MYRLRTQFMWLTCARGSWFNSKSLVWSESIAIFCEAHTHARIFEKWNALLLSKVFLKRLKKCRQYKSINLSLALPCALSSSARSRNLLVPSGHPFALTFCNNTFPECCFLVFRKARLTTRVLQRSLQWILLQNKIKLIKKKLMKTLHCISCKYLLTFSYQK